MTARLTHRGPDDEGYYLGEGVGLAVRRLSIIDVTGGHQPLANEDGTVWITYNGEIYNHEALRAELLRRGHAFRTRTDTEMVVHAYEEWGEQCVERFVGMFAFGLWDERCRRLFLARDRFGVKPLYYAQVRGRFLFASEIRPLLAEGSLSPEADLESLRLLFESGFIPSPRTMFRGIWKLPAACFMVVGGQGTITASAPQQYWDVPLSGESESGKTEGRAPLTRGEALERIRDLLRDAVSIRRMSEVPLGALLSGGLDSTTVVALLQSLAAEPVHTVSIAFETARYDESAHARIAAVRLGTKHHVLTFGLSAFDELPRAIEHLEEPQCSATSLPIFFLYRACREAGLTVVLTGEGADELFAGYHWYRGDAVARSLLVLPSWSRRALARSSMPMSPGARRVLARASAQSTTDSRYRLWQEVLSPEAREALLTGNGTGRPPADESRGGDRAVVHDRLPSIVQMRYTDARTRLVDFINLEVDRLSMAHSVEARLPFLDHRLWEFVCRLPAEWFVAGRMEKALLREAVGAWLPREVIHRRKWGLSAPHADWLRRASLPEWAEELLQGGAIAEASYFRPAEVMRLRREHQAGQADHSRALMGVLTTQLWHRMFIDQRHHVDRS